MMLEIFNVANSKSFFKRYCRNNSYYRANVGVIVVKQFHEKLTERNKKLKKYREKQENTKTLV